MEKKYLIINIGSTSKKYYLFSDDLLLFSRTFESDNINPLNNFLKYLYDNHFIDSENDIYSIALRVVAPGSFFTKDRIIDSVFMNKLLRISEFAPLHINPLLSEIKIIKRLFPNVKIVGISDSGFHNSLPVVSRIYPIKKSDFNNLDLYRFGFHGISLSSIISRISVPKKTIICHLGGGSSITALKDGKSIDTSMGFSPSEGLLGSSRSGSIDPSLVIFLGKSHKLSYDKLESYINNECGFFGLSKSRSFKELISRNSSDISVKVFVNYIKRYIGSYFAVLNGLDLLVFSGAIGKNSSKLRELVCNDLSSLGVILDRRKNISNDGFIHSYNSKVKILVIESNESYEMLKRLKKF